MVYEANANRYEEMRYQRSGNSGLLLPVISLGFWQNFGGSDSFENGRAIVRRAFDLGITHFDLADNYGPPAGSAESTFGHILQTDLRPYRDEMIISTKAGHSMWPGPYGNWGSRKHLIAGLEQSLRRMHLDYVDIFYHHRPDPETSLEETMTALHTLVQQGKTLYVGLSNYEPEQARAAARILKQLGTPCVIHQPCYSLLNRDIEVGLLDVLAEEKIGCIAYSPLAQGVLTDRYLQGIPADSRAGSRNVSSVSDTLTERMIEKVTRLQAVADRREQTLTQMALAWVLRGGCVTSALIGASKVSQVEDAVQVVRHLDFSEDELQAIDDLLSV